jgi:hypothetical protein
MEEELQHEKKCTAKNKNQNMENFGVVDVIINYKI